MSSEEMRTDESIHRIATLTGCGPDEGSADAAKAIAEGLKKINEAANTERGRELKEMLREGKISREEFAAASGTIADETKK